MSSCSDEEFRCTSGECISAALRCNFKTDCENGSDEEFCGICIYILGSIFKMSNSQPLLLKCLSEFCLLFPFFFFFLKGSCTFEDHTCGWKDISDASYYWKREMANITSRPGVDHTSGNQTGKF